ncbi:hypothetical protein ACVHNB_09025 [Streptomyces sp. YJ-C3]
MRTPQQLLDKTVEGPSILPGDGTPSALWSLDAAVDVCSPQLLLVRDVILSGSAGGGIVAYGVKDGKERWRAPGIRPTVGYLPLPDRLVAAIDEKGTLRTYVASAGVAKWT